jgi:nicotinamidase/pyrazinamidase
LLLVGLATDFCVAYSALDAVANGFEVKIQTDACRAIDNAGSLDAALTQLRNAGVQLI